MARIEAKALRELVGKNGDTVETVHELIAVGPETERLFRAYARRFPEERPYIRRVLQFRQAVAGEFVHSSRAAIQASGGG